MAVTSTPELRLTHCLRLREALDFLYVSIRTISKLGRAWKVMRTEKKIVLGMLYGAAEPLVYVLSSEFQ
ncbi:hypothetical protein PIB30_082085, partial [Stylosanthes scabra]|nr:hypothetical protein [Stylosanthes scabra]